MTSWELRVLLAWVRILILLRGEWTGSIWQLVVVKPRCRSQVECLQKVQQTPGGKMGAVKLIFLAQIALLHPSDLL